MKYRKSLILALCIFLFAFAAGCDKSPAPPVQADTPPSASQTVPIQTTQSTEQEIIDPTDLEALWQEYIYDSLLRLETPGVSLRGGDRSAICGGILLA